MKPIEALDAETCRALIGVAFDVDDTVTHRGRLEAAAFSALWDLAGAGLRLVAVTGRPHTWARVIAPMWPVDLVVAENGGSWVRHVPGEPRVEGFFEDDATRRANLARLAALYESLREHVPGLRLSDESERLVDLAFTGATGPLDEAETERLAGLIQAAGARCLVSSVQAHATFSAADKAKGLARAVAATLGHDPLAEPRRWLFVGDSPNDVEAFAAFPVSAGVANLADALPRLAHRPAFLARLPRGRGFAEIARHVLDAHGPGYCEASSITSSET
jgi:HAD superfamily hydrolase (TIGR01484 family)